MYFQIAIQTIYHCSLERAFKTQLYPSAPVGKCPKWVPGTKEFAAKSLTSGLSKTD
ncbi:MAG: hypothetical protein IPI11_02420 [Haliscomenobacter sp.]|nr:hypothetical protein [Haliscomenobacter sp.]